MKLNLGQKVWCVWEGEVHPHIGLTYISQFGLKQSKRDFFDQDGKNVDNISFSVQHSFGSGSKKYLTQEEAVEGYLNMCDQIIKYHKDHIKKLKDVKQKAEDIIRKELEETKEVGLEDNSMFASFLSSVDEKDDPNKFPPEVEPEFYIGQKVYVIQQPDDSNHFGKHPDKNYDIVTAIVDKIYYRDNGEISYYTNSAYRSDLFYTTFEEANKERIKILNAIIVNATKLKKKKLDSDKRGKTDKEASKEAIDDMMEMSKNMHKKGGLFG